MARRLIERGHEVTMVCVSSHMGDTGLHEAPVRGVRRGTVDGIDVIEIAIPYSNYDSLIRRTITFFRYAIRATWIAVTQPCDLVFATSTPLTAGIPGIAARWLRGRRFVFEVRDLWPELPRAMGVVRNPIVLWGMSLLEWCSYHSAHACIGLAPGIVDGIARRGVDRSRIHMIPNAADLDLFSPPDSRNPPTMGMTAVFTGALGAANGADAILDAAAELIRRGDKSVRIDFIGDGKLKPHLARRAREEHLANCCFVDPIPKTQLAQRMRKVDVGLMVLANIPAFYFGTSPNKFFDYLAAGLPVICNYPGWVTDLIRKHECGISVPPDDPKAFAQALQLLSTEPARRENMGHQSRQLAERLFDRSMLAERFVSVLEAAADRS
jgi:glycosyltransferase involved in cell wall biosynthesis